MSSRGETLTCDPHPLLDLHAFEASWPSPLGEAPSPPWLLELLRVEADAPFGRSEEVRATVRDLLRHGGYKPTGRGKPASEYLVRAAEAGALAGINPAVDACNVASLHSGLPISVVDLDLTRPPLKIGLAGEGERYIFNTGGQVIDLGGLLCLADAEGPCANAVRDSQRTKTSPQTRRILALVWGSQELPGRARATAAWYRELLERLGATTTEVPHAVDGGPSAARV